MRTTKTQGRKIEADREVVASGVPALVEPQTVIKDHRPCTAPCSGIAKMQDLHLHPGMLHYIM